MNRRKIAYDLGVILMTEAALMVLPLIVLVIYKEWRMLPSFIIPVAALIVTGKILAWKKPKRENIYAKEGFMIVSLAWTLMSAFGALPFVISKSIDKGNFIRSFVDAFFETVSGFTTTGSTVLGEIASLPRCILFWRAFTHFIGGMGILVFVIAIMPKAEGSTIHIMRAEVPGPTVGKLVSKIGASARILYAIYSGMTLLMMIMLLAGGMPLFDSITNAFATAGTGGFCCLNNSIEGYYSVAGCNAVYCEWVIGVFMMLFGINFNLYYYLLIKQGKLVLKDEELKWFLGIILGATFIITTDLTFASDIVIDLPDAVRQAFFQVNAFISTTGFSSVNFDLWPTVSKAVLVFLMFVGGCGGSTGGGLKVARVIILIKNSIRSIKKAANPRRVETVRVNGRPVDEDTVTGVLGYFGLFMILGIISFFIVSIDPYTADLTTGSTAVFTCLNNVGPGFNLVGPTENFGEFSILSKLVLSFDMLAGRLELFPMLLLFSKIGSGKKKYL